MVNYSGQPQHNLRIRVPEEYWKYVAGWVSRDCGACLLRVENGQILVPEVLYGGTVILGRDQKEVDFWVKKNQNRPWLARNNLTTPKGYGRWYNRQIAPEKVPDGYCLSRYRAGTHERHEYLFADILAPELVTAGQKAEISLKILQTNFDYLEYWQLIFSEMNTGRQEAVAIALPEGNHHAEGTKLTGETLVTWWQPAIPGVYQVYLGYRMVRLDHDGEPFLEPENVAAGYSGSTPANLFLKSQPLVKRPCLDLVRGLRIKVKPAAGGEA
ncbi:MAG TPA: hypothetical protein PKX93_01810 [bacterium]|nr:hypothetical protein [bacterium]